MGSENQAEPVVLLDPVSTHEPQTKDQAAEKDPTQLEEEERRETQPEFKLDSSGGKTGETDSSNC